MRWGIKWREKKSTAVLFFFFLSACFCYFFSFFSSFFFLSRCLNHDTRKLEIPHVHIYTIHSCTIIFVLCMAASRDGIRIRRWIISLLALISLHFNSCLIALRFR
ncbi:hypothetical protein HDV63DRAFT_242089 [Trichoderma sp. SZMC 28014]